MPDEKKHITFDSSSSISCSELIGRKVLAKNGERIGVVGEVMLNPKDFSLDYIKVDKGIFSSDYYVGSGYIESISRDGAVLNVVPVIELEGKTVFDCNGKKVGEVKEVDRLSSKNEVFMLIVSQGPGKKDLNIGESQIMEMGKSIILRKELSVEEAKG